MNVEKLNEKLKDYDDEFFTRLDPVLAKISEKSEALASNLKEFFTTIRETSRYLSAYNGKEIADKDSDLPEDEFMIFRKYVRLLRSCTIMCGEDITAEFKPFMKEFFFSTGKRVDIVKKLPRE